MIGPRAALLAATEMLTAKDLYSLVAIVEEYKRATEKHPTSMRSSHEGYGIIKEEFDEFWDEVKANNHNAALQEVAQVGAMALRYLVDRNV